MRKILILTFYLALAGSPIASFAATYYTYINGGSSGFWSNANTWTTDPSGLSLLLSSVPSNNDNVVILNGYTVSLNANVLTTGHSITINNGGVLNLSTFTISAVNVLAGAGTLRIASSFFPIVGTNTFLTSHAAGATVEYYDFSGILPGAVNYPNLILRNTTALNHSMTFPNGSAYALTINGNFSTSSTGAGTMTVDLGSAAANVIAMTVGGNTTIGSNTTLGVGAFNAIHDIALQGNLTNNGSIDLSNGAQFSNSTTGAAHLTFSGNTNNTLACNGRTDLYTLTVDKGSSSTYTLSVTSSNVSNLNLYSGGQLIVISNGTLRLGSNIDIPRLYGSGSPNYDVGSSTRSPMLWIDGATVNANGAALVVYGKFRISAGTFTSLGGQGTVIREEGQYLIEGGTFNTEKFRPSTTATTHRGSFTMTGGELNAMGNTGSDNRYARFSIPYPEQVFIMSGGIINVHNPQPGGNANFGGIHIGCKASNYNVTGGTFNAVLSGTAAFFDISSVAPFYDLNILKTGGTPTTVRLDGIGNVSGTITGANPLTVLNDFTIQGANAPVFDANDLNVSIGGDFTIESGGTYTPDDNETHFVGSSDQLFTNSGTITSGLYRLVINKSGALALGGSMTSLVVRDQLSLLNGIFNDGGKIVEARGAILCNATHTGTGSITLNGSSTQIISGNGAGIFGNVVLNNANTPGVITTADITISATLTLAGAGNSLFDINENQLHLSSVSPSAVTTTGAAFSASKMIRTLGFQSDKGVRKTYGNLSAFTYPIGTGSKYAPAIIQLNSAPTLYGSITVRPVNTRHPLVEAAITNNLLFYWKVTSAGFTGLGPAAVSHTYTYRDIEVSPSGDDANYIPGRYSPTSWTAINDAAQVDEAANRLFFANVGYVDGEFTAGVPASFGIIRIFYSKRSGNWNDATPGATPWSDVSHIGPDASTVPAAGDQVYIGDGTLNHTIAISNNFRASGSLEIRSGSVLDIGTTTGHNFGVFNNTSGGGIGTLRISSATAVAEFPAGDFGNLIRASGGTVEYYSTGTVDYTIPIASASPSLLPLSTYRNLIITPGANRNIVMPNQDMRIYGNLVVQGAASTALARFNSSAARTLTIDGNINVTSGTLRFNNTSAQAVEVKGNIVVGASGIFNHASSGSAVVNQMTLHGSLQNNGVFDMSNTASYVCNVTFTGASNASITGTGSTTDFNVLTVSKGTSQSSILEVNASAFSLSATPLPLVLEYGTFRLTSAQTVTIATNADFTIPSTARLSANGGTLQLSGADGNDLLLSGTLQVLNGTVNVGTTANENSIEYAATGSPTIIASGGSLIVQGQIRRSSSSSQGNLIFNASGTSDISVGGGAASVLTRGVFEILNSGSFTMSGGNLRIARGTGAAVIADLYLFPAINSVTGGTIEIGGGSSSQTVDINTAIPLFNLSVSGNTNIARLEANPLTLRGSLTINATDAFFANSLNVSINGNLINSNASAMAGVTAGGYRPGVASQTTTFNASSSNQIIAGAAGNLTNFGNLVINNTFAGGIVSLQDAITNIRVNGNLTLTNGTFAGASNTITAVSTVSNSSRHTSTGSGSVTLAGASAQLLSGNGAGRFGNLTLTNPSGAVFGASQEVSGTLTLSAGTLRIGAFALVLSSTAPNAVVSSPSNYIITSGNLSDGGITKSLAANASSESFTFPIGVSGKYTPVDITYTTGGTAGSLRVKPVNSRHPNATGAGLSFLNYYWNITATSLSFSLATHIYTYASGDALGDPTLYRDARFSGGSWTVGATDGNPDIVTRRITFTNTALTADYTAGEPSAFVNPTTYTSIASGSWDSDLSVWDADPPGSNLGPPEGSVVIVSEGHTVTVPTNTKRTASIEIRGRLALGATAGHDFGTVTTTGAGERTVEIQSSTFPGGNFSQFHAAGGGTVEYNGVVTLPTQPLYNNLRFTGSGTKIMPNTDLIINGDLTVVAGTVNNAVNNRNISLVATTGDLTNNAGFDMGFGSMTVGGNLVNTGASATFVSGSGTDGLIVNGNLTNSGGATFTGGSDGIAVMGDFTNNAIFNGGSGDLDITGNLFNTGGIFTAGASTIAVGQGLTNNAVFNNGSAQVTVQGVFTNTSSAAAYNLNAGNLTVMDNFVNTSGAGFTGGSGSLTVMRNWQNSATFTPGTGSVIFASAASQVLTGATSFYNLRRTSGGALSLNNDISVGNLLTMVSGNIVTGTRVIRLLNTAAVPVTGFSASSFIDGRVSIAFPGTAGVQRVYPVGSGTIFRPVTVFQTAASSSAVVLVEMINTPPSGSYPASSGIFSEARHFAVNLVSGTMNSPRVELNFNTNLPADENITIAGNVRVMRSTVSTGPWTDEGGTGVFSPAAPAGYVTSDVTSIASQTVFAIAYQDALLPITLGYFRGHLNDGVVVLEWATYSEKDNDYFTIERSGAELSFDSVGFVNGNGSSQTKITYDFRDARPLTGVSYYRLRQTDFSGKTSYSNLVVIVNDGRDQYLTVYPNPSEGTSSLFAHLVNGPKGESLVEITDVTGKLIFRGNLDLSQPVDLFDRGLGNSIGKGVFLLRATMGDRSRILRFVVH